jgi:hypothetical protein
MTQYINKDALMAEIEKRLDELWDLLPNASDVVKDNYTKDEANITGKYTALESFSKFLDTLEVKEVDLDEAARKWEDNVYLEKGWQDEYGTPHAPFSEIGNAFREGAKFMIKAQKGE